MSFCTADQVRACNEKLNIVDDVPDSAIIDRITEADSTLIVDLSGVLTETEITALGSSNKMINLLSTWKSVELTLSKYYGAARQADEVSDIEYWRSKYNNLLTRIIDGDVNISETSSASSTPKITPGSYRKKLFPQKGLDDFGEGAVDDEY